ncbi:ThiF family adenylyltransferase [Pelagibius litoralis]|uniref:ThiF family adenylyltransferase n=1 Tax=Pelagibius litoralis TaxID=374515 RepID=A0A967F3G7_9PROT|nr:ThiF family adenylyltransferase [Pelagibius litoralis]NIA72317.1 ThiF family adenylyltransferase [Pelagibius litoralis]
MNNTILRLHRSWWYKPSDGAVEVFSLLEKRRLKLTGDVASLLEALSLLDRGTKTGSAAREISCQTGLQLATSQKLLHRLQQQNVVVETHPETSTEADQYDRQVRFFDFFERDGISGADLDYRLRHRKVIVVGIGGYGTWLALLLGRLGVKRIVLIDQDKVESTNLHRQVLFNSDDLGKSKVKSAAAAIQAFQPDVEIETIDRMIDSSDSLQPYLDNADLVINAFGYREGSLASFIYHAAAKSSVPCLTFSGSWIGPLTIPGRSACVACLQNDDQLKEALALSVSNYERPTSRQAFPAIAPRLGTTACLAVWEAVRFLAGLDEIPSVNNIIIFDSFHYIDHKRIRVERNPDCPVCGSITPKELLKNAKANQP